MVEKKYFPNLLIIGGGSKSGKTTMACRIIEQSRNEVYAIKISPHFHEKNEGLKVHISGKGYAVYEETDPFSGKDTSRMLKAGAAKTYLLLAWDAPLPGIFIEIMCEFPSGTPVICESPSLRDYFEPGMFILMSSDNENKRNDIRHLQDLPHLKFKLEELSGFKEIPIRFRDGKWIDFRTEINDF